MIPGTLRRILLLVCVAVTACSSLPPGQDELGLQKQAQGRAVLAAISAFHADRGEYPVSLHELVPRYLRNVPFDLGLRLDPKAGLAGFGYDAGWRGTVLCTAPLGTQTFTCRGE